jgi:hypothetical protein
VTGMDRFDPKERRRVRRRNHIERDVKKRLKSIVKKKKWKYDDYDPDEDS